MYIYIYIYIYTYHTYKGRYIHTYMHNLPPLIITPPNKKNTPLGGNIFCSINLDGSTVTPPS